VSRHTTEPGDGPRTFGPRTFCVVVAGTAHARVLVLEPDRETGDTAASELVEASEITNPMVRARNVATPSRDGGRQRGQRGQRGKTPARGIPEHPEHPDHRRDIERHFAAEIAEEAAAVWSCYPPCELIVAASPAMLAVLRPAIQARTDPSGIHELARDLTKLSGPQLHDELAGAGLVPARGAAGRDDLAHRR
jgi:protein required for attachment to host cells